MPKMHPALTQQALTGLPAPTHHQLSHGDTDEQNTCLTGEISGTAPPCATTLLDAVNNCASPSALAHLNTFSPHTHINKSGNVYE